MRLRTGLFGSLVGLAIIAVGGAETGCASDGGDGTPQQQTGGTTGAGGAKDGGPDGAAHKGGSSGATGGTHTTTPADASGVGGTDGSATAVDGAAGVGGTGIGAGGTKADAGPDGNHSAGGSDAGESNTGGSHADASGSGGTAVWDAGTGGSSDTGTTVQDGGLDVLAAPDSRDSATSTSLCKFDYSDARADTGNGICAWGPSSVDQGTVELFGSDGFSPGGCIKFTARLSGALDASTPGAVRARNWPATSVSWGTATQVHVMVKIVDAGSAQTLGLVLSNAPPAWWTGPEYAIATLPHPQDWNEIVFDTATVPNPEHVDKNGAIIIGVQVKPGAADASPLHDATILIDDIWIE